MATSVVPALIDALVTNARTALPALNVYDGFGVTDYPGDFLMIGVNDPNGSDFTDSADSQQAWANANGTARDETGQVWCVAFSWTGDTNQKAARDAAFATVSAVENMLRSDPTQGVANVLWAEFGSSQSLKQDQDEHGASAQVAFQIHFRARI